MFSNLSLCLKQIIWADKYFGKKIVTNKLEGFPKVYYINLPAASERNTHMTEMFKKYNIENFERYEATPVTTSPRNDLFPPQYGCFISHLEVISKIAKGDDNFAIIMEDDTDISTVDQWNFTWKEFIKNVPHFQLLQLVRCQIDPQTDIKFKVIDRNDHSAGAYMITRDFARKVTRLYDKDRVKLSGFKNARRTMGPVADDALFRYADTYSACIFSMRWLGSQISMDGRIELCCTNYVQSLFKNKINLTDIFNKVK